MLLQAEEHGVTRANAAAMRDSPDPIVRRLVGTTPWLASFSRLRRFGFPVRPRHDSIADLS